MQDTPSLFIDEAGEQAKDGLTKLVPSGDLLAPEAPLDVKETGLAPEALRDLALKLAHTTYNFTTEWAARHIHLRLQLTEELLRHLASERMLEVLGQVTPFSHRYSITERGAERTKRLLEISGYIGPAPVSLAAYKAMLENQIALFPPVKPEDVKPALSDLVLEDSTVELAGLALASGRSLFLFGPPGNGKTSLGRLLHRALEGELWIPYAISVDNDIIRLFDPLCHQPVTRPEQESGNLDRRWVRIRRPLIIAGGELTIESLDLAYSPALRYYEAPLHVKANGGIFMIDDFGRQRVEPHELLNRWIVPLEYRIDHLALRTGQQIQMPFRLILIVATNLEPATVTDSAFLRRMGYRLQLDNPNEERFVRILERSAAKLGLAVPKGLPARLIERFHAEGRELRCSNPQDLLDRVMDTCRYRGRKPELNEELVGIAWEGHFGHAGL